MTVLSKEVTSMNAASVKSDKAYYALIRGSWVDEYGVRLIS